MPLTWRTAAATASGDPGTRAVSAGPISAGCSTYQAASEVMSRAGAVGLLDRLGPQVDALVVERPEGVERGGLVVAQGHAPGLGDGLDHGRDEAVELGPAGGAQHLGHLRRQVARVDDACADGVLEVVADVGDAVGPGHDLALGRGGGGPVPGVVAHRVERLDAQVERREHHIGAEHRVVVATVDERRQRPLGRVAGGTVATVVPGGGGRGERHVEAHRAGDADGDLADLDGVGEAGAEVVVVGGDEHLALAGEAPEGPAVLDAVEVALEAGAEAVGLLGDGPVAGALGPGGEGCVGRVVGRLAPGAGSEGVDAVTDRNEGVRHAG